MLKKMKNILLFLFVTYTLVGFFAVPLILKSQLKKIVEQELNAKLSIESVYFNPFSFRLVIDEIALNDLEQRHLFSLDSLDLNIQPSSLYKSAIHIKSLLLQRPKISLTYKKDKTINFASILKHSEQKEEKSAKESFVPRILLDNISIASGCLDYEDYTNETPFEFSFENIGFNLKDIDTKDFNSRDGTIRFYTSLGDGGFLDIKGQILSLEPFEIKGSVEFEASKLYSQWKYFQDHLNLEVADGQMDFKAKYYFNLDDLNATTIDEIELYAGKLRIKPKNEHQDILNLDHFTLSGVTIKPMLQDIHIKNLALESLHLRVKREKDGEFDWSEYIKTSFAQSATEEKKADGDDSKPWKAVIDEVALEKIKLDFIDETVSVETNLNELNLYAKNLTLAGVDALTYRLDLRLNEEFVCKSSGEIKHSVLDIKSQMECSALDIVRFKPYLDEAANEALSLYDLDLKSAIFGFDANLSLVSRDDEMLIDLRDANLNLSQFSLYKTSTDEKLLEFADFGVKALRFDSKIKEIDIEKTTLNSLDIFASIYKDGTLNFEGLAEVKASKNVVNPDIKKISTKKEKDFRVRLGHFAINDAGISFKDGSLERDLETKLDKININVYKIDSKEQSWLKYDAKARLNHKGTISTKGDLQHTPLKQKSDLKLNKISLKEFSPYLQKTTYLDLKDAYLDLSSKVEYEKRDDKPDLRVYGSLGIKEFFLNDSRDGSTLLSFAKMQLNSFEYEMKPDRVYINELDLNGFYVKATIDKQKILNFATLVKESKEDEQKSDASKLDFKIMKLNIASGSAKFEDLSLPLEFKTDIHDLNGVVYAISNQDREISYVDVAGEVDKYGSTKLSGSVDSSNPKNYLDLDFNFRNLELNALSGYSANFAGYKIDEGKLFLDLDYKIVDSKLLGKNSIIIKKIKLGQKIEDENITILPLGFAIALLEDGDGVIDINMPVEGDVDAPDFKYGAMVLKTFANLIVRAVASPFKFLGSMMGLDGEKLEYIEFEAGVATLLPPEREKLNNILKIMLKRPKISLKITPQYDEQQDAFLLKREKLLVALMKKSGAKSKKEQLNSLNIDLLKDIYEELNPKIKLSEIETKLKKSYSGDVFRREYLITLVKEAANLQELTQAELDELAVARGEIIREYLVENRALPRSRLIIEKIKKTDGVQENWVRLKMDIEAGQ